MVSNEISTRIAKWRSRRGLLELDLLLVPFAHEKYEKCDTDLRKQFDALLELDDMILLAWFRRESNIDKEFENIVAEIRAYCLEDGSKK